MEKRKPKSSAQKSSKAGAGTKASAKSRLPKVEATVTPKEVDMPPREELIPGQIEPQTTLIRGPRKPGLEGAPPPRLEYHKKRSKWFQARASWPYREAPTQTMVRERGQSKKTLAPAPGPAQWELVGPTNIGGRMTCIVCHPAQPERIWAGAAGGGVWFSPDAGQTWHSQWHDEDVLNVGALAIDPVNPDILYCGTGEANLSADSYAGVGIYRTLDGGKNWHLFASTEKTGIPARIGAIAIDPFDTKHIRIGGVGFAETGGGANDLGGMYFTHDAGITWQRETFVLSTNYWCHSIVFDPKTRGTIYATFTARGPRSGIYKSTDGGKTWTQLKGGLPPASSIGRTSLALSPSNTNVLYAFAADEMSASSDQMLGVFRTSNGGKTWTNIAGTHFKKEGQISYGNTIAVHPKSSNHVICGGVDLHLSTDGGKHWTKVTRWDAERGTNPKYAHADHHCLLMPAGRPGRVYDPNDGGMDLSEDGGLTWVNRSNGLAATMYYDLDVAQSDGRVFGGGAQDNGTLITTDGGSDDHREILGGDGGWMVIDPKDAGHLFASVYNLYIVRFRDGTNKEVPPPAPVDEQNSVWMCFIAMDPNDRNTLFTASSRVWRTKNDGDTWTPVSATLDGSTVSAIEIALANSKQIYVGTENGGFFRSMDGGNTWSSNLAGPLPGHSITRLGTNPGNANQIFATVANFGHSHVFRSKDGGLTWEDADKGQLPDVPHHSMAIPRSSPNTIYVCNDVGVFVSTDAGETWMNLTRNLPHVMVVDLVYHEKDRTLNAATYGRSIWRLKI
ncbi:MAG: WD40/YVTN/BNR-like repeat-containing protein [Blastocatellia bacterium]